MPGDPEWIYLYEHRDDRYNRVKRSKLTGESLEDLFLQPPEPRFLAWLAAELPVLWDVFTGRMARPAPDDPGAPEPCHHDACSGRLSAEAQST